MAFDIDANGIVHVSAKDLGTGKEQKIRIESSSGLSQSDIDRMIKEAESHASEDKQRKHDIEVRNNADALLYTTEKTLKEHGDKIDASDKANVESALGELREALKGDDITRIETAAENVTKASRSTSPEQARNYLREQLVPKIRALFPDNGIPREPVPEIPPKPSGRRTPPSAVEIVVIGASTGGPNALTSILASLPADFPVPVLIVQHLPENFTTFLAGRLDAACRLPVREARGGDFLEPGVVFIAPGNLHLETRSTRNGVQLATTDGPMVNSCRPAADVLFKSAASCFGSTTLGIVLTGMGQDGLEGSRAIRNAGGRVIAQDKNSSVVWGMPGQVTEAGLADKVLPISEIGAEVIRRVKVSRP